MDNIHNMHLMYILMYKTIDNLVIMIITLVIFKQK